MKLHIESLRASPRGPKFSEAVLQAGIMTGEAIEISPEAFSALQRRFPAKNWPPKLKRRRFGRLLAWWNQLRGAGDLVEALAKPIAKAAGLSCLDAGGQLRSGSPCAARRDAMNRAVPFRSGSDVKNDEPKGMINGQLKVN
jgi:hypothetical protein